MEYRYSGRVWLNSKVNYLRPNNSVAWGNSGTYKLPRTFTMVQRGVGEVDESPPPPWVLVLLWDSEINLSLLYKIIQYLLVRSAILDFTIFLKRQEITEINIKLPFPCQLRP